MVLWNWNYYRERKGSYNLFTLLSYLVTSRVNPKLDGCTLHVYHFLIMVHWNWIWYRDLTERIARNYHLVWNLRWHFAPKLIKPCNTLCTKSSFLNSGTTHLPLAQMKKHFWKIVSCKTISSTRVISRVKSCSKERLQRLSLRFPDNTLNTVIDMHTELSPSNCHPIMVRYETVLVLGIESPVHRQFPLPTLECDKWLFLAFVKSETSLNSHQLHKKSAWCIFPYKSNKKIIIIIQAEGCQESATLC